MTTEPHDTSPEPELLVPVLPLGSRLRRARLALYDAGLRVPLSWIQVADDGRLVFGDLSGRAAEELLRFLESAGAPTTAPTTPPPSGATESLFDEGWFVLPYSDELILGGAR